MRREHVLRELVWCLVAYAHVVLVAARFNTALVDQLIDGARQAWRAHGGAEAELLVERVPGAFELPLAAKMFAASGRVDAVVALGCVIRGDTPHFDYVAGECARGLMDAGLATDEAFLVAVKRMGELDALSREFAREHSERLWTQLVVSSDSDQTRAEARTDGD